MIEFENKYSDLFDSTAGYYRIFRPAYPEIVFEYLIERFHLKSHNTVLDLGCGTGQLAIPFAQRDYNVFAVDPSIEMISQGLIAADATGTSDIWWRVGNDQTVEALQLPELHLCVMGASFHWMDREKVLNTLYGLTSSGGGIAVLGGAVNTWADEQDDWNVVVKKTVQDFLGQQRRAGKGTYEHPKARHEEVISNSQFEDIIVEHFTVDAEMTIEEIVGLQLSTSYASPRLLDNRIHEFQRVLTERLLELSPSGSFQFRRNFEVISAKKCS